MPKRSKHNTLRSAMLWTPLCYNTKSKTGFFSEGPQMDNSEPNLLIAPPHSGSIQLDGHSLIWDTWAPLDCGPTAPARPRRQYKLCSMWPGIRDNRPLVHLLLLHSASLVDPPRRASRAPPGVDGLRLFAALVAAPPSQLDGWQRIWHPLRPHNLGNLEGAQRARLPSGLTHGASVSHGHQTARRALDRRGSSEARLLSSGVVTQF